MSQFVHEDVIEHPPRYVSKSLTYPDGRLTRCAGSPSRPHRRNPPNPLGNGLAAQVLLGQFVAPRGQCLVRVPRRRATPGFTSLQTAEHVRYPALFLCATHPSRKQHDDLVAISVRTHRLAPTFAAADLDLRF